MTTRPRPRLSPAPGWPAVSHLAAPLRARLFVWSKRACPGPAKSLHWPACPRRCAFPWRPRAASSRRSPGADRSAPTTSTIRRGPPPPGARAGGWSRPCSRNFSFTDECSLPAGETARWLVLLRLRQRRLIMLKRGELPLVEDCIRSVTADGCPPLYCLRDDASLLSACGSCRAPSAAVTRSPRPSGNSRRSSACSASPYPSYRD